MEAIDRLKLKLSITDDTKDDLLSDYLLTAEDNLKLFLNVDALNASFASKLVELAKIYYLKDFAQTDSSVKSESYSEGVVSESTTYKSGAEYDTEAEAILDSLKRYRRVKVYVRNKKEDSTEEETE